MYLRHSPPVPPAVLLHQPDGTAGILATVRQMRALVRKGRTDPAVRLVALNLTQLLPERDDLGEIRALFEFVRDRIRYISDVHEVETLHEPAMILQLAQGDCDDKAILLASLLESIGYVTRFVITAHTQPGVFDHVYLEVLLDTGEFMPLDASEPEPMGWSPPMPLSMMTEE